jgi:hypothetical protein
VGLDHPLAAHHHHHHRHHHRHHFLSLAISCSLSLPGSTSIFTGWIGQHIKVVTARYLADPGLLQPLDWLSCYQGRSSNCITQHTCWLAACYSSASTLKVVITTEPAKITPCRCLLQQCFNFGGCNNNWTSRSPTLLVLATVESSTVLQLLWS